MGDLAPPHRRGWRGARRRGCLGVQLCGGSARPEPELQPVAAPAPVAASAAVSATAPAAAPGLVIQALIEDAAADDWHALGEGGLAQGWCDIGTASVQRCWQPWCWQHWHATVMFHRFSRRVFFSGRCTRWSTSISALSAEHAGPLSFQFRFPSDAALCTASGRFLCQLRVQPGRYRHPCHVATSATIVQHPEPASGATWGTTRGAGGCCGRACLRSKQASRQPR